MMDTKYLGNVKSVKMQIKCCQELIKSKKQVPIPEVGNKFRMNMQQSLKIEFSVIIPGSNTVVPEFKHEKKFRTFAIKLKL